jgi:hypothetical protein
VGIELAHDNVPVLDEFDSSTTFYATSGFDKLDATVYTADVLAEFEDPKTGWGPSAGAILRGGLFQSISGLGGVTGVRFKRKTPGVAATLDFRAFS